MLPSKGYFSSIPCVFFLGKGCGRPCCHYRHSLQDVKTSRSDAQTRKDKVGARPESWSDDQVSLVTKLVEKAVDKVFREEPGKNLKMGKDDMVRDTMSKILLDNHALKWAFSNKKDTSDVPAYEPTPISKLNETPHIPVMCVPQKPSPKTSQFGRFQAVTPSFSNSCTGEASQQMSNNTQYNYAGYCETSCDYGVGPTISGSDCDDFRPRYDEEMECDSPDSNYDSYKSQIVLHPNLQCSVANYLHDSDHDTDLNPTEQPNQVFSSTVSQPNSHLPVFSSPQALPSYSDSHCSGFYGGPLKDELKSVSYYSETNGLNTPFLESDRQDVNFTQTKDTFNSVDRSSKHERKDSVKHKNLDSKITDCSNVNQKSSKKPLRLKDHESKSNRDASKSGTNDRRPDDSKRRSSDTKSEQIPSKKSKNSIKKGFDKIKHDNSARVVVSEAGSLLEERNITDNLGCDATSFPPTAMGCSDYTVTPATSSMEGNIEEPKIDLHGKERKHKSVSNFLKVSGSVDPFTRWMKNKKIREILGKGKDPKRTGDALEGGKKLNKETKGIPENSVAPPGVACENPEPLPVPKFVHRVAHEKDEVRPYPMILDTIKIPLAFRQHFCDAFFQEFKKTMVVQEAKVQAMQKELDVAKSSGTKSYKNNGSLQLMKLRKNGSYHKKIEESKDANLIPSSCPDFTFGWSLFRCFSKYLMTEDEMIENGYPFPIPGKPNCAFVEKSARKYSKEQPSNPSVRVCANCSEEFRIGYNGVPITKNDCFYHWGRLRKVRSMGQWLEKFTCCDGLGDAGPCESSSYHVWSGRNEDCMEDFVETTKLPSYMEECDAGIYALDCEMCYTSKGLELARLTVINLNEDVVFDQVVSLERPVLDYCTRFSGIDETKIRQATYTFQDVRAWVLANVFDKTILVGHSLENDLKALKLIHKTVIDTSVTFPHKFGPPNRMSLKHLASSLLRINIQEDEGGHDSKEDAATCLKLLMMKIREDSKVRKPRIIIGYNGKKK